MQKNKPKKKSNNSNNHTHENRLYKVKKPLPYSKSNMVITFSVKLYYIYRLSDYYTSVKIYYIYGWYYI